MSFLNVGPFELMVVLIIAILVIGPQRLVEIVRTIGRLTTQLRQLSNEFTSALQMEILSDEMEKMHQSTDVVEEELTQPFTSVQSELQAIERETRQVLEDTITGKASPTAPTDTDDNPEQSP